jgi:hypothetical protein
VAASATGIADHNYLPAPFIFIKQIPIGNTFLEVWGFQEGVLLSSAAD